MFGGICKGKAASSSLYSKFSLILLNSLVSERVLCNKANEINDFNDLNELTREVTYDTSSPH